MIFVMAPLDLLNDCRWRARPVAVPAAARLKPLRKRVALLARADLALGVLVVAPGVMAARMETCLVGW
ncbi:MAG TPA: hypothetical protein VED18_09625 [Candidatus Sulfotelmatobacter sp.]|nr:hypothetical protein [Candidatus Sulfotelmatobacter sp.]